MTSGKHAGENLADILAKRSAALDPPVQMCDALSRNLPKDFKVILANCLAHARRRFVDVEWNFPKECGHVLETLEKVYKNDAVTKQQGMTPEQRLQYHQAESRPLIIEGSTPSTRFDGTTTVMHRGCTPACRGRRGRV